MRRFLIVAALVTLANYPALEGKPVIDAAQILPQDRVDALNQKLFNYQRSTGHQLMVVTVPSLDGQSIEEYAQNYFRQIKLGSKDRDDGALLLIAPKEHKDRFQTGYGMRVLVTDAQTSQMLKEDVTPHFRSGDFVGGIEAGVDDFIKATTPLTPQEIAMKQREAQRVAERARETRATMTEYFLYFLGLVGLGGLGMLVTRPARRRRREEAEQIAAEKRAEQQKAYALREQALEEARQQRMARELETKRKAMEKRAAMLAAMAPTARVAFLQKEKDDAAAAAARREAQRRKDEAEEARRRRERESSSSSSYGGLGGYDGGYSGGSDYSSSSSSSSDSFSGGGGDSGGGGSSDSW